MAEDSDQGDKTETPSQQRIDDFRKRGDVAISKEVVNVLLLAAVFMTLSLMTVHVFEILKEYVQWLYNIDHERAFSVVQSKVMLQKTGMTLLKIVGPIFLVVGVVGILGNIMQVGIMFSPEVLNLKWDRVNPLNGIKKIFSFKSVFEAIKSFLKFVFILSIVYMSLKDSIFTYRGFFHMDYVSTFFYGKEIVVKLAFSIILSLMVLAIIDFGYQKYSYFQKLKMTKEEQRKEHKEQEGSPEVRQRIRSVQREMASKRMMEEVSGADAIITNPTHISIAIKYDAENMISPAVVAKGADHLAMRIREVAKKNDVPIVENVPLARSLYATVKEGAPVPREQYKAVAQVLAFVYKLKKKKEAIS